MRGRNTHRKPTFNEIVARLEDRNAQSIMDRAVRASRLAKTLSGRQRESAYRVKTNAVRGFVERLPAHAVISNDNRFEYLAYVVVGLRGSRTSLHVPARAFKTLH